MGGDKDFTRWLRDYDNRRLDPDGGSSGSGSKLNWHSSKYDLESMNWQEVQSIYLPEIENCWGPACNYLRKLWFKYKMQKRQGEKRDVILDISRILYAMGLPLVEFDNGPDIEWIKAQLDMENRTGEGKVEQTSEDVEAKYEEDQEKRSLGLEIQMETRRKSQKKIWIQTYLQTRGSSIGLYVERNGTMRESKGPLMSI
jgi:hypothetical protein